MFAKRKIRGLAVLALLAVVGLAAACGGDDSSSTSEAAAAPTSAAGASGSSTVSAGGELDQSVIDAAKKEGKVVLYSSETNEMTKALGDAFKKRYGITVEALRLTSSNLIQRFSGEQSAGVHAADNVGVSTLTMYKDNPQWFLPLDASVLPNMNDYPKTGVGENYIVTSALGVGLTYNTDLVKPEDVPKSWKDVLDPKFKGKIVLSDLRSAPLWMEWAELMRRQFGEDYLTKLRAQSFDLVDSAAPGAQKLAAGAYALSFPAAASHSAQLRSQGAPLKFILLDDATLSSNILVSIVKDAPHPNAARVYLNWLMTPEAQQVGCGVSEQSSLLADIPGCVALKPPTDPSIVAVDADKATQGELLDLLGISR